MNLNDFRSMVDRLFVKRREGLEGTLHAAIGMAGESGEVLDLVKKTWVTGELKPLDADKLLVEAGDAFHYLMMLCITQGWTLEQVAERNRQKLALRYPGGVYTDAPNVARRDQS